MSKFEKISEHIWIMHAEHETDRPILAAIVGSKRTLLMDGGNSEKHANLFKEELVRQGIRLPEILFLTHWHWDHIFGCSVWNIPTIAHEETSNSMSKLVGLDWSNESIKGLIEQGMASESTIDHIQKEFGDNRSITVIQPDVLFTRELTIDLGDVTCEIKHVGGDHTSDSSILYVKEDKVLFLGDCFGPSVYGGPRYYTSSSFNRLVHIALEYEARTYVESHGVPMERDVFYKDINEWAQVGRFVEQYGDDVERIRKEMILFLNVETLPNDFNVAIEWFIEGLKKSYT